MDFCNWFPVTPGAKVKVALKHSLKLKIRIDN